MAQLVKDAMDVDLFCEDFTISPEQRAAAAKNIRAWLKSDKVSADTIIKALDLTEFDTEP